MKKSLTIIALLAGAASVYSQGQVNFTDYVGGSSGFNISIWSPNPASPSVEQTGNTASDSPAGSMHYAGTRIGGTGNGTPSSAGGTPGTDAAGYANGDNFTVELYAAAGEVTSFGALSPIPATAVSSYMADGVSLGGAGEFQQLITVNLGTGGGQTGTPGAPFVAQGAAATFAIACWYNMGGTLTTLAGAMAAGVPLGWSPLGAEDVAGGPGNKASALNLPAAGDSYALTDASAPPGISSFSLTIVPEPSTIALGVIGASAFLMRLRRKQ